MNKNFNDSNIRSKLIEMDFNNKKKFKRIPFFEEDSGGILTIDKKKIIFISIIDLFTQYG
jgi:hypothetical protein